MYVSFLSRRLSAHPSSPGPGHSTQISILAPQQHLPPVGLGHPALSSVPPHPQHEPGWAAGRLVARALLGSGRLARCCPLAPAAAPWLPPGEPWLRARFSRSVEPSPPITHGPWPWPTPTSAAPARNRLCPRYPPHTALPAHPRRDSSIATSLCRVTAPLSFIGFLLITVPASPF